ncbi:MAG: flippase-like domain-containing protein [Myxococcales bacterium]|nr:flippase-like domain-containing protein [Myxococcales bacterium]
MKTRITSTIFAFLKKHLNLILLVLGLGFFVKLLLDYDMRAIWSDLSTIGVGFVWILALWLGAVMADTVSWRYTFGAYRDRVPYHRLGLIMLAGHAINNVAPSGNLGEVVKGKFLGQLIGGSDTISSLVIYNYMHFVWDVVILLIGASATLFLTGVPLYLSLILVVIALLMAGLVVGLYFVLHWGLAEKTIRLLTRLRIPLKKPEALIETAERVDHNLREFYAKYPRDFWVCAIAKGVGRALATAEIWAICLLLGKPISVIMAFFIMSISQLLFWLFAMVPSQVGVMEKSSDMFFGAMGYRSGFGFTFELVRRARRVVQVAVGLLALLILNLQNAAARGQTTAAETIAEPVVERAQG